MSKVGLGYRIQLKGMDKLVAGLLKRAKMDVVKQIVKQQTAQLQTRAQQMTGTVYAHPTGATKRGIKLAITDSGLSGIIFHLKTMVLLALLACQWNITHIPKMGLVSCEHVLY